MSSKLRASLARKKHREVTYDIVEGDPTLQERAFDEARLKLVRAERAEPKSAEVIAAAQSAVDEARAALEAVTIRVRLRSIAPHLFEELLAAHPATKEQQAEGDQWNVKTLTPALLAACAIESDLSEPDWVELFTSGEFSMADRSGLYIAALNANILPRSVSLPKD